MARQKVVFAKERLDKEIETYNSEELRLDEQHKLDMLKLDRSKSSEQVNAIQNELNNQINIS